MAVVDVPASGIQNGSPDGLALVDGDGTVLEFLSYEGAMTRAPAGPPPGMTSTDIGVSRGRHRARGPVPLPRLRRRTDALSGQARRPPPRARSTRRSRAEPDPANRLRRTPTHEIGAVQGTGAVHPARRRAGHRPRHRRRRPARLLRLLPAGRRRRRRRRHLRRHLRLQHRAAVDLGDTVAVTGTAQEFGGQTQISAATDVDVCADGTAADLPAPRRSTCPPATPTRAPRGHARRAGRRRSRSARSSTSPASAS